MSANQEKDWDDMSSEEIEGKLQQLKAQVTNLRNVIVHGGGKQMSIDEWKNFKDTMAEIDSKLGRINKLMSLEKIIEKSQQKAVETESEIGVLQQRCGDFQSVLAAIDKDVKNAGDDVNADWGKLGEHQDVARGELEHSEKQLLVRYSTLKEAKLFAEVMKNERDNLKTDIVSKLIPLEKTIIAFINTYGDTVLPQFLAAKKESDDKDTLWVRTLNLKNEGRVKEKSTEIKKKLEEINAELNQETKRTEEHKELVKHGIIHDASIRINEIDENLIKLNTMHKNLLSACGWDDDRITSGINLNKHTDKRIPRSAQIDQLRKFFINKFNIDEIKLVTDKEKLRLDLEVQIALLHVEKKRLRNRLVHHQEQIQESELEQEKVMHDLEKGLIDQKEVQNIFRYMTPTDIPTPGVIQPDSVLQEEQTMITTLEINFRRLVETIFKNFHNWWNELVPYAVRQNAKTRNNRNKQFLEWEKTQDFKLLGKLNFPALTKIFTNEKVWNHFSPVFPKPEDGNFDMMWSIRQRCIETSYCRQRVDHSHRLEDMMHKSLKVHYDYFMESMDAFFKTQTKSP